MKSQVLYLLFITLPLFCFSQIQEEKTIIEKSKNGTIQSVEFSENDKSYTIPANSAAFFKDWLKTYPKDQFIKVPHFSKRKEFVHEHFDQHYNGVKVVGGGYNFHYKNGKMLYAHGNYININEINTSPSISAEKAKELFAKYQNIPLTKVTDFIPRSSGYAIIFAVAGADLQSASPLVADL